MSTSEIQLWAGGEIATVPTDDRIAFNAQALALREQALDAAAIIGQVTTPEQNRMAVAAQTAVDSLLRECEKTRKSVKGPIIEAGRKVEAVFDAFTAELKSEKHRLSGVVGDFLKLEEAKARAAAELQRIELQKIEDERLSALKRAQAEADKRALEEFEAAERIRVQKEAEEAKLQAALAHAKNHDRLDQLQHEANDRRAREQQEAKLRQERLMAEAEERRAKIESEAKAKALEAKESIPAREAARATGQAIKIDYKITVTDIYALQRAHPNLVDLTPRIADIKAAIKAGITIQGVHAEQITTSVTRSARGQLIEV